MRGRRPKPSALRRLQGNPGKRPLNEAEPRPRVENPECPKFLIGLARQYWKKIAPLLVGTGVLTTLDATALTVLCQAFANWLDAERKLRRYGPIIKAPSGYPVLSPYFSLARSAFQQVMKVAVEFGMTPSSRSRLRVEKPQTEEDPLEAFLKRGAQTQTLTPRVN
jgi:P27 family predicted phage terminase small subunit